MYNIYSYEHDLLQVVRTEEEARRATQPGPLPGEYDFIRDETPYTFKKRQQRLRHPIEVLLECNPDFPANLPDLSKVVDWLDEELILGDTDKLIITAIIYNDGTSICVKHEYLDGGQQGCEFYDFNNGELHEL